MRRYLVIPVIAGLLLTLGVCGAKEDTATSTADAPAAAKSSDGEKATTTTEGDGEESPTTEADDSTELPDVGDLGNVPGLSAECQAVATMYTAVLSQSGEIMGGTATQDDIDKLEADLEAARDDVPDEIKDAFETFSKAWSEYAVIMSEITKDGGFTDPGNLMKIEEASEKMDDPEVKAASDEIDAFITESCG